MEGQLSAADSSLTDDAGPSGTSFQRRQANVGCQRRRRTRQVIAPSPHVTCWANSSSRRSVRFAGIAARSFLVRRVIHVSLQTAKTGVDRPPDQRISVNLTRTSSQGV